MPALRAPLPQGVAQTGAYHPSVSHCLEFQVEDPLLTRLSRGASYRGTVVIGQKETIAFSSCTSESCHILVSRVGEVSHNLISFFHQGAHRDLDVEGGTTASKAVFTATVFSTETLILGQDRGQGLDLLVNSQDDVSTISSIPTIRASELLAGLTVEAAHARAPTSSTEQHSPVIHEMPFQFLL